MNKIGASTSPSPKTVWVRVCESRHLRQIRTCCSSSCASWRIFSSRESGGSDEGPSATKTSMESAPEACCKAIEDLDAGFGAGVEGIEADFSALAGIAGAAG